MLWRIRIFEDNVTNLYRAGMVPGFVHVCSGQEAVSVGVCAVMEDGDYLFSGHRAHGHFLARGSDPFRLMAEILGRRNGACGGFGGSMHLVDVTHGAMGATGVVGGNIPLAAGAAWAASEQGRKKIAVVFFGDGAGGNGTFHETLNLAALWHLPVLFVCENNGYAEFTSREEHSIVQHLSLFAAPYKIPSVVVDGNDVSAVESAAKQFVADMRASGGPRFLECMTYRLSGHYVGDPEQYRSKAEIATWGEQDPIERLKDQLLREGVDQKVLGAIEVEVRDELIAVVERARAASMPDVAGVMAHVYVDPASAGEGH